MKNRGGADTSGAVPQSSRRKFLKKALIVSLYAAPVVVSFPSTVFATHRCMGMQKGMVEEHCMGMQVFTPGCTLV